MTHAALQRNNITKLNTRCFDWGLFAVFLWSYHNLISVERLWFLSKNYDKWFLHLSIKTELTPLG